MEWATAVMATPGSVQDLADAGFAVADLAGADANDLVLAVRAPDAAAADAALERPGDRPVRPGRLPRRNPGRPSGAADHRGRHDPAA